MVDIDDRKSVAASPLSNKLLSLTVLTTMERRGIEINQYLGTGIASHGSGLWIPNIFADGQPHSDTLDINHTGLTTGSEVADLIEHLIVG